MHHQMWQILCSIISQFPYKHPYRHAINTPCPRSNSAVEMLPDDLNYLSWDPNKACGMPKHHKHEGVVRFRAGIPNSKATNHQNFVLTLRTPS